MQKAHWTILITAAAVTVVAGTSALYGTAPTDSKSTDDPNAVPIVEDDRFVVHEWGTFTSFSGSDGVKIEFRPLVDNDLPPFVLDRGRQAGRANPFSKVGLRVVQRMETPITYFYTDRERDVQVKVGFPEGLLTEFYPPIASMKPDVPKFGVQLQQPKLTDSELDWGTLHLIPPDRLATHVRDPEIRKRVERQLLAAMLPGTRPLVNTTDNRMTNVFSDVPNPYYHARETDSAIVHVRREPNIERPSMPTGDFFEKFLFYRGVGNFELPLSLTANGGDEFVLANKGAESIRGLFLVTVDEDGIRYTRHKPVGARSTRTLQNTGESSTVEALAKDVEAALMAEGLYAKEARSMVNTWRESWFGERGTRLFYIVPTRVTEELLPLTVAPRPDETVRVLVGRLEIMSPEDERRVTELVKRSAERREKLQARPEKERDEQPITAEMMIEPLAEELGRLLEPGIVRVRHIAEDPKVAGEARRLSYELAWYHEAREAAEKAENAKVETTDWSLDLGQP